MKLHEIKIDAQFVDAKTEGLKYFEIRKNDRDYQVGDLVRYTVVNADYSTTDMLAVSLLERKVFQIEYITDYAQKDGYIVWQERELIRGGRDEC